MDCLKILPDEAHSHLMFLSVLNIFLSISAALGNILILVALRKESSLHPPSKLLYRNLAITDLCVGIIVEPAAGLYWISEATEWWGICWYVFDLSSVTGYVLCSVSLMTVTAVSIDRLLALLLRLRYRQVVTLKKIYATLTIFWVSSIILGTVHSLNPLATSWWGNIGTLLFLVTSTLSYTKIFLTLRQNQIQPLELDSQAQSTQATPLNMARYRKAVSSALWVQAALVACYLPYAVAVVMTPHGDSFPYYLARQYGSIFLYLNSSLNPFLYCWKIREVRQAVKETLRQVCCPLV